MRLNAEAFPSVSLHAVYKCCSCRNGQQGLSDHLAFIRYLIL